jgi:diacylglycerol kinase (ATP)
MTVPNAEHSPAVLFANGKSRQGQELFDQALKQLREDGVEIRESRLFREVPPLMNAVRDAVKAGIPLVIVGGGDGTMSAVVQHFVGKETTMGVLPFGTGNAFARDLSIPFTLPEACKVITEGTTRRIDLGYAGNDYFVNVVTAGLTARIVVELNSEAKKRLGRLAYVFAMARALARMKAFHAKVITPDQTLEFETLQVVVGNGRYHAGPFPLAPDASITEGKLSMYALATTNRAAFLKLAWMLRTGRQCELPEVYGLSMESGRLETTPSRKVVVDGEIVGKTPIEFKVVPGAIAVRVPAEFKG